MPIGNPVTLTSNVASKVISITATASQTVFTIDGGYRINQISVYRNGTRLADSLDYTARDGASVTLLSPATLADVLEFQVFDDFRVADAIVSAASNQTIFGNLTVTGTLTGATIGIQSGGTVVGTAKTLNFVGTGNTFAVNGDIIDVSIAGGGGGGGGIGTVINYADSTPSPFSFIDAEVTVTSNLNLDATNAGATTSYVVSVIPNIIIGAGIAVTVGVGKTMVIDILNLGDL
jgi:hypothetical protein